MVLNLICIILGIIFIAFFAGFNLDNKCDVNLVFHSFKDVHVFFTILISFAIGMACSLPFALIHRAKKNKSLQNKESKQKKEKKSPFKKTSPANSNSENQTEQTSSGTDQNAETSDSPIETPETTAETGNV